METTARSMGYTASANITPRMYQMTPFVDFWGENTAVSARYDGKRVGGRAHLFAFAHEEADGPLEEPLEACRAEAEDVARDDDREAARERDDDLLRRAARVVQIQSEEACATSAQ